MIAGRATFRLILYGANVALLAGWGAATFARYAAASGALVWVLVLAQAGPEKTALKLLPRGGEGHPAVVKGLRMVIRLAPPLAFVLGRVVDPYDAHATRALYAAAAAQSIALGLNIAAVATQRALGRLGRDLVRLFGLMSMDGPRSPRSRSPRRSSPRCISFACAHGR